MFDVENRQERKGDVEEWQGEECFTLNEKRMNWNWSVKYVVSLYKIISIQVMMMFRLGSVVGGAGMAESGRSIEVSDLELVMNTSIPSNPGMRRGVRIRNRESKISRQVLWLWGPFI